MKALLALMIANLAFFQEKQPEMPEPPERIAISFVCDNPKTLEQFQLKHWVIKTKILGQEMFIEILPETIAKVRPGHGPMMLDSFSPLFSKEDQRFLGMVPNIHELSLEIGENKIYLVGAENRVMVIPSLSKFKDVTMVIEYTNFETPLESQPAVEVYVAKSSDTDQATKELLAKVIEKKPIPRGQGKKDTFKDGEKIFICPPVTTQGVATVKVGSNTTNLRQLWEVRRQNPFMIEIHAPPIRKGIQIPPTVRGPIA